LLLGLVDLLLGRVIHCREGRSVRGGVFVGLGWLDGVTALFRRFFFRRSTLVLCLLGLAPHKGTQQQQHHRYAHGLSRRRELSIKEEGACTVVHAPSGVVSTKLISSGQPGTGIPR